MKHDDVVWAVGDMCADERKMRSEFGPNVDAAARVGLIRFRAQLVMLTRRGRRRLGELFEKRWEAYLDGSWQRERDIHADVTLDFTPSSRAISR